MNKIEKTPLRDFAYETIKEHLLSGEYEEGSLIPSENKLASVLSVSRVVVREALKRLREENFIVTFKGRGSFFANPKNFKTKITSTINYDQFVEIMQFRFTLESEAIRQIVKNCANNQLIGLYSCVESMKNASGLEELNNADYSFHEGVIKCSGNALFLRALSNERDNIMACFSVMNALPESKSWSVPLHEKIVELLLEGDGEGAIKLLKTNGEYNFARMKKLFN